VQHKPKIRKHGIYAAAVRRIASAASVPAGSPAAGPCLQHRPVDAAMKPRHDSGIAGSGGGKSATGAE
jgi:hypothetical protein